MTKTLKELKKRKKLSCPKLGKLIEVHYKTIVGWESGEYKPSPKYYPALCNALGITEEELLKAIKKDAIAYRIKKYSTKLIQLQQELLELDNDD